jgi:hypothetical protein
MLSKAKFGFFQESKDLFLVSKDLFERYLLLTANRLHNPHIQGRGLSFPSSQIEMHLATSCPEGIRNRPEWECVCT